MDEYNAVSAVPSIRINDRITPEGALDDFLRWAPARLRMPLGGSPSAFRR